MPVKVNHTGSHRDLNSCSLSLKPAPPAPCVAL